ncbi:putative zinc-finger domain [Teratosphaeria destructans]|uniref:Zinc-finger domain n=1 Tax=Teratosphaeria destructans TaxID=418781 RepID=A0A9W7SIC1_9PEZI|nr:putative zinc-finger domain [Teratosphaeria destructans]
MSLPSGSGAQQQQQQPNGYSQGSVPVPPAPHNAPAVPAGIDLSVLQSMTPEQVAAVAHLIQLGLIKPPPMPGANSVTAPPAVPAPTVSSAPQNVPQPTAPTAVQDVETDKEEGELEEGEEPDPAGRDFLRPPPTGPRKRSPSPMERYGRPAISSNSRAFAQDRRGSPPSQKLRKVSEPVGRSSDPAAPELHRSSSGSISARPTDKSLAARGFVLQMHKAGYTFDQLAEHVPNRNALEKMYRSMDLPVLAHPRINGSTAPSAPSSKSAQLNGTTSTSAQSTPSEARTVTVTRRPAPPARPAPTNRADYLAKLAAAKAGKSSAAKPAEKAGGPFPKPASPAVEGAASAAGHPSGVSRTPPPPKITLAATTNQPVREAAVTKKISFDSEKLKQRMEALKAENAAKAKERERLASSDPAVASSPVRNAAPGAGLGAGIADIQAKAGPVSQTSTLPVVHMQIPLPQPAPVSAPSRSMPGTPGRPFPGLPGLFMAPSPVQGTPTVVSQPPQVSRPISTLPTASPSSAVASNAFLPAASPSGPLNMSRLGHASTGGPLIATHHQAKPTSSNQSRSSSESEGLVIEVSEDEDDNDEDAMELDSDTATHKRPDHIPNFPSRTGVSAPGTPTVATPRTLSAYELKMKEIEAQKRRIAEIEARKAKKAAAPTSGHSTPTALRLVGDEKAASPMVAIERGDIVNGISKAESKAESKAQSPAQSNATGGKSAKALAREEERAMLEKRLKELHEAVQSGKAIPVKTDTRSAVPVSDEPRVDVTDGNRNIIAATSTGSGDVADSRQPHTTNSANGHNVQVDPPSPEVNARVIQHDALEVDAGVMADDGKDALEAATIFTVNPATAAAEAKSTAENPADQISRAKSPPINGAAQMQNTSGNAMNTANTPTVENDDDDAAEPSPQEFGRGMIPDIHARTSVLSSSVETESDTSQASSDRMDTEDEPYDDNDNDDDDDDEADYEPEVISPAPAPTATQPSTISDNVLPNQQNEADDLASELQPPHEEQAMVKQGSDEEVRESSEGEESNWSETFKEHKQAVLKMTGFYKPYESPLMLFHDYRFHPGYLAQVKGGFRSLTYSNRISWDNYFCTSELEGKQCTNRFCSFQHYASMVPTDSRILQELGTYRSPTGNLEEEKRWKEGLTAIIKQLRNTDDGRDVEKIAAHIAAFRRSFVGDPSKVLTTLA